jgi:hypothetical protein
MAAMAAWVAVRFGWRGRGPACFCAIEIETGSRPRSNQPLVSICRISPNSSATVVAVQARGGEPLIHRLETAPSPGTHPLGEGVLIRRARNVRLLSGYL